MPRVSRALRRHKVIAAVALGVLTLAVLAGLALRDGDSEETRAVPFRSSERVAFDGTNYFVVWDDDRGGQGRDIFGARVSHDGMVLDRPPIRISTAVGALADPQVAFDGRNFLVVWSDERLKPDPDHSQHDVFGARITRAGVVLDRDGIPISTAERQQVEPKLAFEGSRFLVVWTDFRSYDGDIYGARVTTAGKVLDPTGFVISSGRNEHLHPTVVFDGTRYLVVWSEGVRGGYDIFGARVSRVGKTLNPKAIRISRGANAWDTPAVAFGDENYLVAWTHWETGYYQEVRGARVSPDGIVLDPEGLVIAQGENDNSGPKVAFDGSNYLVVWNETHEAEVEPASFVETGDVYSARVSTDGAVLDAAVGRPISTARGDQWAHGLGFDGASYFLALMAERTPFSERYDLRGVHLTREGERVERPPTTIAQADSR